MIHQETALRGEEHPLSKHTNDLVKQIIDCLCLGTPNIEIARMFDIDEKFVSGIKNHKYWKNLTENVVFPENRKSTMINQWGKAVAQYDICGNYIG